MTRKPIDPNTDNDPMNNPIPPQDRSEILLTRKIVFSIILIGVFIGLPLWHLTTSVHRAELPQDEIFKLTIELNSMISYDVPVYIDLPAPLSAMLQETQLLIDNELREAYKLPIKWGILLRNGQGAYTDYKIQLEMADTNEDGSGESIYISPFDDRLTKIFLSSNVITKNKVPEFITKVLLEHVFKSEIEMLMNLEKPESVIKMPYSPDYHISLSLLQGGLTPIGWDVENASKLFINYLSNIMNFANFTLDTQVEHYEKLSSNINLDYNNETGDYLLKETDTSTFIDYSEWGLDQNTADVPAINFIIYIPSIENKPIQIENSQSNSFIVPQWGGVSILNTDKDYLTLDDLIPVMEIFASHLFQLIGAPSNPKSPFIRSDILTRFQTLKNLKNSLDNLISLVKLCNQLETISIPDSTLIQVNLSIEQVRLSIEALNIGQYGLANNLASKAFTLSNKAFFQKDMVQQMYFPDEHKMAVYVPLLGPIVTIVALGFKRSLSDMKMLRKSKTN